ncbi:MAG: 3-phosphoshikimate-carboxyvinyltransferase [Symbiobacteriaceae bacterium]|nr:3-phosphoshikimate-carboxyvinyltransferase [Symbiobacteriaceae bacterium]
MNFMDVQVYPAGRLAGTINPPGSKNYTTRYLLAAALAEGESVIHHPADSEDSEALQRCLLDLGATLRREEDRMIVRGFGVYPRRVERLDPGNAGAVLRFLMAVCAATLPQVTFVTRYAESLGKRPQQDLLDALAQLGVRSMSRDGRLPITLFGGGLRGGTVRVSGEISSQYTSALLFAAPLIGEPVTIEVLGDLKSKPPIRQTLRVLGEAGIKVEVAPDLRRFHILAGQRYLPREYVVPGDYPGAAAIMSAAAVVESDVVIERLFADDEQGEREAIDVLRTMGADIEHDPVTYRVRIRGGRPLHGATFDGDRFTDAVPALAAAATVAAGTTVFENVENLRYKECDRISDYGAELRKVGASVEEERAKLIIHGRPDGLTGCEEPGDGADQQSPTVVDSRIDHRVIMGLTIAALRSAAPIIIRDAHHVATSYPAFFDNLRSLGVRIDIVK